MARAQAKPMTTDEMVLAILKSKRAWEARLLNSQMQVRTDRDLIVKRVLRAAEAAREVGWL